MVRENLKKLLFLVFIVIAVGVFSQFARLDTRQLISVMIIALLIGATFLYWHRRLAFAFVGVSALLFFRVLDIEHLLRFSNLDIIIFLIGMMIIVGYLERNNFFEYFIGVAIDRTGQNGMLLVVLLMLLSAATAALIDEVTSILIMTAVVLHLASKYKVNPIPFVLMTVFSTNIGSSATVVGNPVGIMVAIKGGLSFSDFLRWATPVSLGALLAAIAIMLFMFRRQIKELGTAIRHRDDIGISGLPLRKALLPSLIIFTLTIAGLILHTHVEKLLHMEKNTMLLGTSVFVAGIVLMFARDRATDLVERRVDWWTLLFFMFLFASVGSLEYTGAIDIFSSYITRLTEGGMIRTMLFLTIIGGAMSAILDNVLAVAVLIPIVGDITAASPALGQVLWWVLLFSATLFGNLTPMGSTANIVALGVLNKRGLGHIGFREWMKYSTGVTLATAAVAFLLILFQVPLMKG